MKPIVPQSALPLQTNGGPTMPLFGRRPTGGRYSGGPINGTTSQTLERRGYVLERRAEGHWLIVDAGVA